MNLNYENILLSVIVSVYKTEDKLERCLKSVFNQAYKNFEIILINDGSNEDLIKEIIDKFDESKITLINNKKNIGLFQSRLVGIQKSRGGGYCILRFWWFCHIWFLQKKYFKNDSRKIWYCFWWIFGVSRKGSKILWV
ncbi:MAG: glycosyltransferase family 2 protein [Mycoplasma sp.]|nr:glycosyltransferase family 2 protein [Mycoplasma sp.]